MGTINFLILMGVIVNTLVRSNHTGDRILNGLLFVAAVPAIPVGKSPSPWGIWYGSGIRMGVQHPMGLHLVAKSFFVAGGGREGKRLITEPPYMDEEDK